MLRSNHDFSQLVNKFVRNKSHCYFVSPHFDDAVFSAGELINYLSDKVPVYVINIFTKAGGFSTLSAKAYLKKCGFENAEVYNRIRNEEDRVVLSQLNAKRVNLGFTDALWREKNSEGSLLSPIYNLVPELKVVYPTYRIHIVRGVVSKKDGDLIKDIEKKLKEIIGDSSFVFCPVAFGGHVDHIIVRDICAKNFKNVIFWQDFPYNLEKSKNGPFLEKSLETFIFSDNPEKKRLLILKYKSQIEATFSKGNFQIPDERYYQLVSKPVDTSSPKALKRA